MLDLEFGGDAPFSILIFYDLEFGGDAPFSIPNFSPETLEFGARREELEDKGSIEDKG